MAAVSFPETYDLDCWICYFGEVILWNRILVALLQASGTRTCRFLLAQHNIYENGTVLVFDLDGKFGMQMIPLRSEFCDLNW